MKAMSATWALRSATSTWLIQIWSTQRVNGSVERRRSRASARLDPISMGRPLIKMYGRSSGPPPPSDVAPQAPQVYDRLIYLGLEANVVEASVPSRVPWPLL